MQTVKHTGAKCAKCAKCWCHFGMGDSLEPPVIPVPLCGRNPDPTTEPFEMFAEWIPAFAGMTALQMTSVPAPRATIQVSLDGLLGLECIAAGKAN